MENWICRKTTNGIDPLRRLSGPRLAHKIARPLSAKRDRRRTGIESRKPELLQRIESDREVLLSFLRDFIGCPSPSLPVYAPSGVPYPRLPRAAWPRIPGDCARRLHLRDRYPFADRARRTADPRRGGMPAIRQTRTYDGRPPCGWFRRTFRVGARKLR
jgi:hypothetical protein